MALNTRELFMETPKIPRRLFTGGQILSRDAAPVNWAISADHVSDHALMAARAAKPAEARSRLAQVAFGRHSSDDGAEGEWCSLTEARRQSAAIGAASLGTKAAEPLKGLPRSQIDALCLSGEPSV
jgi:hypothetical protein